jgi:hypothetical protein
MKFLIQAVVIAVAFAAPVASFAQSTQTNPSNQPLTRAQVRADLARIEQAGYHPSIGNDPDYPADVQAAEARVAAEDAASAKSSYGPTSNGTSQSGGGNAVSQ